MNDSNERSTDFERRSKALFDESVEQVNGNIRSRLTQARHAALAGTAPANTRRAWWPAAGLITAALAAVVILMPRLNNDRLMPEQVAATDDVAILLNSDDLELIEDMAFFAWMDSEESPDSAPAEDSDVRS